MNIENIVFWIIAIFFFIEQIMCWDMWSYPYRFGLLFKTVVNAQPDITIWRTEKNRKKHLHVKIDNVEGDVFLRYKYPFGGFGPLLFVAQISPQDSSKINIRVGLFSLVFYLWIIIDSMIMDGDLIGTLLIVSLVGWFYFALVRAIKGTYRVWGL